MSIFSGDGEPFDRSDEDDAIAFLTI